MHTETRVCRCCGNDVLLLDDLALLLRQGRYADESVRTIAAPQVAGFCDNECWDALVERERAAVERAAARQVAVEVFHFNRRS